MHPEMEPNYSKQRLTFRPKSLLLGWWGGMHPPHPPPKSATGYFERVRKVQTTLPRIFIVLESVSHGLSEISRKGRKFKRFFRPKSGGLQKKKGLHRN